MKILRKIIRLFSNVPSGVWPLLVLACGVAPMMEAQVPNPQVPVGGTLGTNGNFPLLNSGSFAMPSDANYTVLFPNTTCIVCKVTSSVSLTATRNLVMPGPGSPAKNMTFNITNATSGGQSIQVIASSGTGVTIANGNSAWVWFDGTNYKEIDPPSGGGGDTITSPGSTLSVGGTSTNTTLDVNLAHANNWTAPQTFSGSGPALSIPLSSAATTVSGNTSFGTDSSGNLLLNKNGTAAEVCDSTNGVCAASVTSLTSNSLNTDVGTSNFISVGDSTGLIVHGGYPEKMAILLGISSGNWHINNIGSSSGPDWLSCSNSICNTAGAVYQNGAMPVTFPLGVTNLTKTLLYDGFNDVSVWAGSATAAQLDYFRGHWLAWSILYGVPDSQKMTASASCTHTGTWTAAGSGFPSGSLSTIDNDATMTCTGVNANDAGIIYMRKVSDTGTFTMTINGTSIIDPATSSTTIPTSASYTGSLGGTSDLYALGTGTAPNTPLTGGLVTIALAATGVSTGNPLVVVAPYALTQLGTLANSPPVVIGLAAYQCNNGTFDATICPNAITNHTDAEINAARTQQITVVNELRGLLNIGLLDWNAALGMNANNVFYAGQVNQITVTAGGSGFGTPVVTFTGGSCTIQPTMTGANLPPVSGGAITTGTYYVTTPGACTGIPTVTITGGSGATATAIYEQDFVHGNENAGTAVAALGQAVYNSAARVADKQATSTVSSGGGCSTNCTITGTGSTPGLTVTSALNISENVRSTASDGSFIEQGGTAAGVDNWIMGPLSTASSAGAGFIWADLTTGYFAKKITVSLSAGFDEMPSLQVDCWASTQSVLTSTCDSGFSRTAANTVALGNGAQGDATGTLNLGVVNAGSTTFTGTAFTAKNDSTSLSTTVAANYAASSSGSAVPVAAYLAPNLATGAGSLFYTGLDGTTHNDSAGFGFGNPGGTTSALNYAWMGTLHPDLVGTALGVAVCSDGSLATNYLYTGGTACPQTGGGITTPLVMGPASAPSGSCPLNGAWVFSQDGHATFCASGTWTTKI